MKLLYQISSIIIALLFVFTINFKSILTLNYYANQSEIAELFCINKEKPKLECDGKCHLATQISKIETEEENTPFTPNTINYNLEVLSIIVDIDTDLKCESVYLKSLYNSIIQVTPCKGFYTISSPPPRA